MALSAAVSVAAFSAVLAESFVAVSASTLVPATFVSLARAIKAKAASGSGGGGSGGGAGPADETTAVGPMLSKAPGAREIVDALKGIGGRLNDIDLLVPKTAKIHGEFTFEASELYAGAVSGGGVVNVVAIAAAYSAMYSASSTNKITLDVDFAAVNYTL